jgi:hypothetical protein
MLKPITIIEHNCLYGSTKLASGLWDTQKRVSYEVEPSNNQQYAKGIREV